MPPRRTPPGVRELKLEGVAIIKEAYRRRTPPGVRELKHPKRGEPYLRPLSHPSRGA